MSCSDTGYQIPRKMQKSSVFFPVLAPWRIHSFTWNHPGSHTPSDLPFE